MKKAKIICFLFLIIFSISSCTPEEKTGKDHPLSCCGDDGNSPPPPPLGGGK